MLTDLINDQQLLEILLENQSYIDYDMTGLSGELISLYCMQVAGEDATEEDVFEILEKLVEGHIGTCLVRDGLAEVYFDKDGITYVPTPEGECLQEMYDGFYAIDGEDE